MATAVVLISDPDSSFRIGRIEVGLESLQKIVGGYIEAVTGGTWHLYCDEEGKLTGKQLNQLSTLFVDRLISGFTQHDVLVGTIAWLGNDPTGGGERDVPLPLVNGFATIAAQEASGGVSVVRWRDEVWVFDTPGPFVERVDKLAAEARRQDDHGTVEAYPNVRPDRWVELRVELMDHFEIALHDMREDRSYG